jgi:hypothetical protein
VLCFSALILGVGKPRIGLICLPSKCDRGERREEKRERGWVGCPPFFGGFACVAPHMAFDLFLYVGRVIIVVVGSFPKG